ITDLIRRVVRGDTASTSFEAVTLEGARVPAHIEAVVLERDARGGRGVVASVTKVDPHAETGQDRASELGELRDALQRMETHFAELEAARDRERTAWETERQHLEARLEQ